MDEFLKMDIFFVIASLGVGAVTVVIVLVGIKVLRILKDVERISKNVSEESDHLREDIDGVRRTVARLIK